jgi:hypothetical protein
MRNARSASIPSGSGATVPLRDAAIADAVRCESRGEEPDALGQAYLAAADVEQMLGNTSGEREHLTAAQELFAARGNVVEVRKVTSRLRGLTADG